MAHNHQISIDGVNVTVEYADGWCGTFECKIVADGGYEATGFGDTKADAMSDAAKAIRFMISKHTADNS